MLPSSWFALKWWQIDAGCYRYAVKVDAVHRLHDFAAWMNKLTQKGRTSYDRVTGGLSPRRGWSILSNVPFGFEFCPQ
ncbi:uncharacterized protein METZ01_LOCUS362563, partial [marine metagenome]